MHYDTVHIMSVDLSFSADINSCNACSQENPSLYMVEMASVEMVSCDNHMLFRSAVNFLTGLLLTFEVGGYPMSRHE